MLQLSFSGLSEMGDPQAGHGDVFLSKHEEEECADIHDEWDQEGHGDGFVIYPAEFIEYQRQAETEQDQSHEQVVDAILVKGAERLFFQSFDVNCSIFEPPNLRLY